MGDTTDGSSNAAQSARDGQNKGQRGFFGRLMAALGPTNTADKNSEAQTGQAAPATDVRGMLNLRRMSLEDVAVPKAEIVAVPEDIKKDDLVQLFRKTGLTRIPVYKETLDTPVGLVHLKDFALKHGFNGAGGRFSLKKLLRPLLFAPPSMPIGVLLQKMQADRIHMALVIDEYGGVDGLVTLEDLVEQVIGEIEDEHDLEEDQFWIKEGPGCYLAQARTPLEEFEAEIGHRLVDEDEEEEIDTLGGLVFLLSGHVPARGEVVVHPDGPEFEVVDADPRRIKRLRVRLPDAKGD
ncbi:hemolysin family protein [Profundibacter amoris]|uniref:HlyC/CorC family transporter n=1 Tax=Profundibacter amoris TaxID=2171755 RepID=A0A347UDW7_9RHOB|nr:hemolysin family protein [Profundibacter amoris]AXX97045.1 HlyC/CorC family transporter [Profundibacter amoris]